MPGRDLMVRIRADLSDFRNKVRMAQTQVAQFDKNVQSGASKSGKALNALGLTYRGVGLAAVVGAGAAVKSFADFDAQMSSVAATGRDAERSIEGLRQSALRAGNDTAFSATEAAAGVEALLKAGISASDVMGGGLAGSLDLAAAGNLDVAGSAEAAAAAMSQFSLRGEDVPHIADLLAAGAGKANGEVSDMAQALNQAGLVAAGAGATIEETAATLAAFAKSGLLGSDAGTSFKTMLQRLQAPSGVAAAEMKRLNISAYDANGNFVGLAKIADQLRSAFKGQTDETRNAALATIFGSDAVRAANVLYKEGGDGIRDWTKAVDDAGFAAEVAAKKQDNLKGDLEKLKGTLDTLLISGGSKGNSPLRGLVQDLDASIKGIAKFNREWDELTKKITGGGEGTNPIGGDEPGFLGATKEFFQALSINKKTGVPTETVLKFKTEGAANAERDAVKVARAAGLTPKEVRSVLRLMGWDTKHITPVLSEMKKLDRKEFVAQLKLQYPGITPAQVKKALEDLDKPRKPIKIGIDGKAATKSIESIKSPKKPVNVTLGVDSKSIGKVKAGIDGIKQKKPTPARVDTAKARADVQKIQSYLDGLKRDPVYVGVTGPGAGKWAGGVVGFAGGGKVPGSPPSDPRKDNVAAATQHGTPYAIRSGEWIINERASRLNDRYLAAINGGLDLNKILPGFAGGGVVGGDGGSGASAGLDRRVERVRLEVDSAGGLYAVITSIAQGVVDGHATHQTYRGRAGGK